MTPRQVLEKWITAFNNADADAVADLYSADAVNDQVANERMEGQEAIRQMFIKEFSLAEMVCIPENILEAGDWAILEWRDPKGLRGCGFFKIEQGKIVLQRGYWDKLSFYMLHNIPLP